MFMAVANRSSKVSHWVCLFLVAVAVSGCHLAERALPMAVPSAALEEARQENGSMLLVESQEWLPDEWWRLFQDEQLSQFIETAFVRNPTLHVAQANILLAVANAERVGADLLPNIWWSADGSVQKLSKTGVVPFGQVSIPNSPKIPIPVYFKLYETQVNLRYDFDLWDKRRNRLRAAIGEVQANRADAAFARLQLGISVAKTYYLLQIDYQLRELAQRVVANREEYLALMRKRLEDNLENSLSVLTAESNVEVARQNLLQIEGEIAVYEVQLKALLAGSFQETIFPIPIAEQPLPQIPLPCSLPLNLLAHRPDIMAQLWLIRSAGREIAVAHAGFYPDLNLSGLFGFQTIHFRELFRWESAYYNVGPAISLPLFDGGLLLANLHGSQVNYDLAIFHYNELVLQAVEEVLAALAILKNSELQLGETEAILGDQAEIVKLSSLRVENNLDSGLDYLNNEANFLNAREQEVMALGNSLQAIISLIKALGGGYDVCKA